VAILAMTAAAVLTGARSLAAVGEWATDAPQPIRAALGARRDAPDHWSVPAETTIRRTLARLNPEALAATIGAWLTDRSRRPSRRRRAVAVDGKTLRGAKRAPDGRQVHLLATMDHATRAVLAQHRVDGAPGEVPGLRPLLADLDLADTVVTADALHTHHGAAEFLVVAKRRTTCQTRTACLAKQHRNVLPLRACIVTVGHDRSVTPARLQRDRYCLSESSPTRYEAPTSPKARPGPLQRRLRLATVMLRSKPWATSVVRRIWARSGEEGPSSTQAGMMSSPVRLVTCAL
jgi:hypothetical protein